MKSALPKVLHRVAGRPMIDYVIRGAQSLGPKTITVVVGHMKELLRQGLQEHPQLSFVTQEPQLGTGHALLQTAGRPRDSKRGSYCCYPATFRCCNDTRSTSSSGNTKNRGAAASVLTALVDSPTATAASSASKARSRASSKSAMRRRHSGRSRRSTAAFTCFRSLRSSTRFAALATANAQGEYYLTDLVSTYRRRKLGVEAVLLAGCERNSRHQQPVGTGRSEPNRETEKERRAHGGGRHHRRSRHHLHRR